MKFIYEQTPLSFHFLKYYGFLHDWLNAESAVNFGKLSSKIQDGLLLFWMMGLLSKDLKVGQAAFL